MLATALPSQLGRPAPTVGTKNQQRPQLVMKKSATGGSLPKGGRTPIVRCHAGNGDNEDYSSNDFSPVEVKGDWRAFRCAHSR